MAGEEGVAGGGVVRASPGDSDCQDDGSKCVWGVQDDGEADSIFPPSDDDGEDPLGLFDGLKQDMGGCDNDTFTRSQGEDVWVVESAEMHERVHFRCRRIQDVNDR